MNLEVNLYVFHVVNSYHVYLSNWLCLFVQLSAVTDLLVQLVY